MSTAKEREKRNAIIIRKYHKMYHEGMKKYHLYGLLGKEYGLIAERVAEIVRGRQWKSRAKKPKSKGKK
jgi:hypothetical protein